MMNKILITLFFSLLLSITFQSALFSQDIERTRPAEWDGLVEGARFMDRFLPMPAVGELSSENWGADGVNPRYTDNGIEDNTWSYWGGNIIQDKDGKYHQYLCRWREDAPKGHMQWPHSHVVHAISDNKLGPFKVVDSIGKGHNPEIQQLKDGRYFLYVNGGYYLSHSLDGPWQYNKFTYDQRQRPIFDHLANFTFAKREDGSFLMVCRGGGIWLSPDGLPPYFQVSEKSAYPPYDGRYEDPVVWRTNIQYHMIVNDWLGRIAYYLRSKDGINWKLDAGEAYEPGIARHKNGHIENWYKFERIKMLQDEYGRAIQANFAVADTIKKQDLGSDKYSSKNLGIPLTIGRLISILNTDKIDSQTETIEVLVKAEDGFNPHRDMNIKSLRFGASETVNFGKGCKVIKTEKQGENLILIFDAEGHDFNYENFAAKLLGKTRKGKLLFGYARLPWLNYQQQALSAKYPGLTLNGKKLKVDVEIQNFGQVNSVPSDVKIEYNKNGQWHKLVTGKVPVLKPFEKNTLSLNTTKFAQSGEPALVRVTLLQPQQKPIILEGKVIIR
ncbi:glycoside hydrolase family protein [Labilibacter marinus]|uniref:glycoside hydrolase family protein n=1 Tax=Labilibacter marinus TaxID=1477105 RepID=UPI0018EA0469|nr:glycoside hydrolase family protein [Labilibacter marinus]